MSRKSSVCAETCLLLALFGGRAESKRADLTYEELAEELKEHRLNETRDSIAAKLKRGKFAATFLIWVIAALESEGVRMEVL